MPVTIGEFASLGPAGGSKTLSPFDAPRRAHFTLIGSRYNASCRWETCL